MEQEKRYTKEALRAIDELYSKLSSSEEVEHHSKKHDKYGKLEDYFSTLEKFHDRVNEKPKYREDRIERLKLIYYKWCLIKKENIPERYYRHQEEMALERGYGHIKLDEKQKDQLANEVIENQKKSLDTWIDYFLSDDSKFYPFWAKYWAFRGMLKLGYYNAETGNYNKRTAKTTAPFAELNREALAMSIELFIKSIQKERIEDQELEQIVKTNSFQKIYVYILKKLKNNSQAKENTNKGIWIKYNQGSDHMPLVDSLNGRNTGWCTAGAEVAKSQLAMGDFYVYYTLDNNGEYKIPRIAIRMEKGRIAEIRGVAESQNIEPDMEKVVEEKLKEFPDAENYKKKVNDMKKMTEIHQKHNKGIELTSNDLRFLYQIDNKIDGFGYGEDPRIKEITESRNKKTDLTKVFNCHESQIALSKEELTKDTIYLQGDLTLDELRTPEGMILPQYIDGSLELNLTSSIGLVLPKCISGSLVLDGLTSAEDLVLPEYIGECVYLNSLVSAVGLQLPRRVEGDLFLDALTSAEGMKLPEYIGRGLDLSSLKSAKGYVFPKYIGEGLFLSSLTSAEGMKLPEYIGCGLDLSSLISSKDLKLPRNIAGSLDLRSLTSAEGIVLPENIGLSLYLNSLTSAKNLTFPKYLMGELNLKSLTSAEGLVFPKYILEDLNLGNLQSAKNLVLPIIVGGNVDFYSLTRAEEITFPKHIKGNLYLHSLRSAEGLVFPKNIEGNLYLNSLRSAESVVLPEYLRGKLFLNNLAIAKDLVFPEKMCRDLNLNNLTSAEGLKFPKKVDGYLYLEKLTNAKNLTLPKYVWGIDLRSLTGVESISFPENIDDFLDLRGLTSAKNLTLPQNIGGSLDLSGLTSAEGIVFPENIGFSLYLNSLTSAKNLTLPKHIFAYLYLNSLTSAEGLVLPESVDGMIILENLKIAKDLVLPKNMDSGYITLGNLESLDGLIIPEDFDYEIRTKFGIINKDNIGEYRSKGKVR